MAKYRDLGDTWEDKLEGFFTWCSMAIAAAVILTMIITIIVVIVGAIF